MGWKRVYPGVGDNGTPDNTTDTNIPVKLAGAFEDSPLHWSGVSGENIISDETIEVPPGTIQVGEGLKMSAAGVIPLFNSTLTGIRYIPTMFSYDETGSTKPFTLDIGANQQLIVQPDFSTAVSLSGMFTVAATASEFINNLILKCTPLSTMGGMRIRMVAQSTGEAIYYYPSKAAWNAEEGEDIVVDATGDVNIDLTEAPLGLLIGEVLDVDYHADTGDLFGDGVNPYQEVTRQIVTFVDLVDEAPLDGKQYARQSEIWTEVIHEGHYLGVFADVTALEAAYPTANDGDTATVTTPSANLFYWSGTASAWVDTGTGYLGDMLKAVYDPTNIGNDVFSMTNMVEGATAKVLLDTERDKLSGIEAGAEVNVQSDWNQASALVDDFIKNKPDVATITQINNTTGYANYLDSSTAGVPRNYASNSELPLLNDKAILDGSRYPDGVTSYWDDVNHKFTPDQDNGNYSFSVNFNVDALVRDKRLVVKFTSLDAGGPGVDQLIQERLVRLQKDAGDITPVSISFTAGVTPAVALHGVTVTLEFQDTSANVYDIICGLTKDGAEIL